MPWNKCFEEAGPDLSHPEFRALVKARLQRNPALVAIWQVYSYDKRSSAGPYLDGCETGFFELHDAQVNQQYEASGGRTSVTLKRKFKKPIDACADFVYREASWVLARSRV